MKHIMTANGVRRASKERADVIKTLESLTGGRYSTSDGEAILQFLAVMEIKCQCHFLSHQHLTKHYFY